ncbi:hypothetical protein [Paenibacillus sp. 481]|uniref:hypothetical protein n=1 Tax=Paenibacillus sp. 481 TaxID=2835869 RepID=UPI001E30336D|nr:hypothetical protein [Paenibacillus sp. 481]UHA73262.1 hypothetical protein KIK04_22235 [Paenibacillus sp. 481]
MKKKKILLLSSTAILVVVMLISVGFKSTADQSYKFNNIKSNDQLLEQFKNNNLTVENDKKFKGGKVAKLKLDIDLKKNVEMSTTEKEVFDGTISGNLKLKDEKISYNFTGSDLFEAYNINNKTVYIGSVSVLMKNKKATNGEEAILGIRFEPETKKIDVALTSGEIGETAFIPFGEAFLSSEDWEKIDAIKYKE